MTFRGRRGTTLGPCVGDSARMSAPFCELAVGDRDAMTRRGDRLRRDNRIVQVERLADPNTLNPRQVKIPGVMVDCVVVATGDNHWQTFGEQYSAAYSSKLRVAASSIAPCRLANARSSRGAQRSS